MKRDKRTIDELWEDFRDGDDVAYGLLIEHYTPLVDKVVGSLMSSFPVHVERDDLTSEGFIGLMDAISRYTDKGYKFETYAPFRIRGQILDMLRQSDWAPRSFRQRAKAVEQAVDELIVSLQRTPTDEEVAELAEISVDELNSIISEGSFSTTVYFDEIQSSGEDSFSAWELLEDTSFDYSDVELEDAVTSLSDVIDNLKPQEKAVLALYYLEQMSLKDIGELLSVTESRACQIHTSTLDNIRDALVDS